MKVNGIVGREYEIHLLEQVLEHNEPQLIAVYGRRRVGKTYLVKRFFDEKYDFSFTGSYKTSTSIQLALFAQTLAEYSKQPQVVLKNWFEAFTALRDYLKSLKKDRLVVFLDEIPWMDVPRSNFLAAFSQFWNTWASTVSGIKIIACGSATTWMLDKFVGDKGGFYGRSNRAIHLSPFTLSEVEQFLQIRNIQWSRSQIMEAYMIMGGIPYYLDMLDASLPLRVNVDNLFFAENAPLRIEYDFLFRTLFQEASLYRHVVETIARKTKGITQQELKEALKVKDGGTLTTVLKNLQKCDFIRMYSSIGKKERDVLYQLTDNFVLFHLRFVRSGNGQDEHFWSNIDDHTRDSWSGYAFEMVCLHHIAQIKQKLGVIGVLTNAFSWQSKAMVDADGTQWPGVQIDLLLERADNTINVCEMKFCKGEYAITEAYDQHLRECVSTFRHHTKSRAALPVVLITTYGLKKNIYSGHYPIVVVMDDLFKQGY